MTEEEWFGGTDVESMVWAMGIQSKCDRKLRLFAVACCRRVACHSPTPRFHEALAEVEELAEVRTNEGRSRLKQLRRGVWSAYSEVTPESGTACGLVAPTGWESARQASPQAMRLAGPSRADQDRDRLAQVALLRDIFGNPFRAIRFLPKWRTDTAVTLARQVYESRDFGAMPILADALQEAGCDSEAILSHCRDAKQVHVRGCWVVDLVLGKQ